MNLTEIATKFNTPDKCIAFLEKKKWGKTPISPYTGKTNVIFFHFILFNNRPKFW